MIAELAHELLPYAAVLYGVDALVRVRQGERALLAPWGNRFRWTGPGWHLGGLLPTSEVLVVDDPSARASGPASAAAARLTAERDLAAIRERRAVQARYSSRLSVTGVLLFATTFGALPMAVYRNHEVPFAAEAAVAAAAALWAVILAIAARALRNAGATPRAVAAALAPALFFPPAAAHVQSFLWRDSFRGSPALAVASVLLAPAEFRRLARHELRRLDEAERQGRPVTPADADVRPARAALLGLLSAAGIDPREVAAADAPRDAMAAVFCPLCEAEYRSGFVTCTDCEVPLQSFAPNPDPSGSPAPR